VGAGFGSLFEQAGSSTTVSRAATNRNIGDMCWRGRTIGICEFVAYRRQLCRTRTENTTKPICFVDAQLNKVFRNDYGSLQSRMKPQTSHRSLQWRSTKGVPQRSHSHILVSVIVVISRSGTHL
ncbi:uncharacterized protein METZ01_LOCUS470959, partial [marine metagenome]